jgi:diguanylate cyclase (GGDEF)-like protein
VDTVAEPEISEAAWLAAQRRNLARLKVAAVVAAFSIPVVSLTAMVLSEQVVSGHHSYLMAGAIQLVISVPIVVLMFRFVRSDQDRANRLVGTLTGRLSAAVDVAESQARRRELQADRQELETRLANALDMAEGEPEVIDVIERSFSTILPSAPVELLLADNSHAHLTRMASSVAGAPGCGVDSPDHCPAARRAQVQRFDNSDDLDACPKLRGRAEGSVSAVCVPVSIMGRTVGVIHATGEAGTQVPDDTVLDLGTLSKLGGARIGLLRVMAETQLQAATDSLTGLLNRRSFETQVTRARRESPVVAVAMADLDHFKTLNDTYGHETGDRALRLFATVLAGSVRSQDLVCRQGGEEFVVALMGCAVETARGVLDAVRARLEAAITVAGLPAFTVSFGLVQGHDQQALPGLIERADVALFEAKRAGRDRVVVHDASGVAVPAQPGEYGPSDSRAVDAGAAVRAVPGGERAAG